MKAMKKDRKLFGLVLLMACGLSATVSSCSKDDSNSEALVKDFSYSMTLVSNESHELVCDWRTYEMPRGLSFKIGKDFFNGNGWKWKLTCDAKWITFDKKEGEKGLGATFYIQNNTNSEDRLTSIELYIEGGDPKETYVNIYQYGYNHYLDEGTTVKLHADCSEMEDRTISLRAIGFREVAKIDWGDGIIEFYNAEDLQISDKLSHRYKNTGAYSIKMSFGATLIGGMKKQPQFGFTVGMDCGVTEVSYFKNGESHSVPVDNRGKSIRVDCDIDRNISVKEREGY